MQFVKAPRTNQNPYYKNFGLYVEGNENIKMSYALMYSVEHVITEKIAVGIGVRLLDQNNEEFLKLLSSFLLCNEFSLKLFPKKQRK